MNANKKNTPLPKLLPHNREKNIYIPFSTVGSVGKTTWVTAAVESIYKHGMTPKVFTGDINHNELVNLYGATNFDVNNDSTAFINTAQSESKHTFVDTPAGFVDTFTEIFGDIDTVLSAFEMADSMPYFVIPVATQDKCIKNLSKIENLFSEVEGDYRIIFVLNEGLMTDAGKTVYDFNVHDFVKRTHTAQLATTMHITTKFTPEFTTLLKETRLPEFLRGNGSLMLRTLGNDFMKKTDKQFTEIMELHQVDDRTPMEKAIESIEVKKEKATK